MTLEYADPQKSGDVDDLFAIMYCDECIDCIPSELRRPSYFVELVNFWERGGEHIFFLRDKDGLRSGVFRAELIENDRFLVHATVMRKARRGAIYKLGADAMTAIAKRHGKPVVFEALLEKENKAAIGMARIMGMKLVEVQDDALLYQKEV